MLAQEYTGQLQGAHHRLVPLPTGDAERTAGGLHGGEKGEAVGADVRGLLCDRARLHADLSLLLGNNFVGTGSRPGRRRKMGHMCPAQSVVQGTRPPDHSNFSSPLEVAHARALRADDKRRILLDWLADERALLVADDEGMFGVSPPRMDTVLEALRGLESIPIALNPLRWLQAEAGMQQIIRQSPDCENLLRFLRAPFAQPDIDEFVQRYRNLSRHDAALFAAPVHERISRGILQPIHNAKAAFVLGHFGSCIGLCGVAVEMLAIFRFDIAEVRCGDQPLDVARQRDLWGSTFERLNQSVRSTALLALGLIDQPSLDLFKQVAGIRNKYLHFLSRDDGHEETDATQVYNWPFAGS